jgi:peptidoglycan/LPS O-acetylase OafA/YrhL
VAPACALLLALSIIWMRGFTSYAFPVQAAGYSLLAVLFGAFLTIAVTDRPTALTRRVLSTPPLVFFGRYSYGIYVLHNPLLVWLRGRGFSAHSVPLVLGSQLPGELLFATAGMAATITLALLSWYCLEQPLLRLKRWFAYEQAAPVIR